VLALALTIQIEQGEEWRIKDRLGDQARELRRDARKETTLATPHSVPEPFNNVFEGLDVATVQDNPELLQEVEVDVDADCESDGDSTSSSGSDSWITPSNLNTLDHPFPSGAGVKVNHPNGRTITHWTVACMTGDFAMQNVGMQLGLNMMGVGGKRIKSTKTWILRCHACFKLCKDPTKTFCPTCGSPSLLRTSISYFPPTSENPKGYKLHLKANYQYRLRGTQFSIPNPKNGRSDNIILREDQKEWIKGIKTEDVRRRKEDKALKMHGEGDWLPPMYVNEKDRITSTTPVVGFGKRNPNEAKKRRR